MSISDLSKSDHPRVEASGPVCVVGGGIAGLLAARRLAAAGQRVIVLESGGERTDGASQSLNQVEEVFGNYQGALNGRCRGFGGTSQLWGGRFLPITPQDVEPRPYLEVDGWPFDFRELDQYRPEIERTFKLNGESYEEDALDRLDRQRVIPRGDADFTMRFPKWASLRNCNFSNLLGDELKRSDSIQIWLNTTVVDFEFDSLSNRLTAVIGRTLAGRSIRVEAVEFLFCPGSIEATRLLLWMNEMTQGRAFRGCEVLGRYFQDHLGLKVATLRPVDLAATNRIFGYYFHGQTRRSLHLEMRPEAQARTRAASCFAHVTMAPTSNSTTDILKRVLRGMQSGAIKLTREDCARLASDVPTLAKTFFHRYVHGRHFWPPDLEQQLNVWSEQLPHWDNRIVLSQQRDELGIPLALIEWRKTVHDEFTFRQCVSLLKRFWSRHNLDRVCRLDWVPETENDESYLIALAGDLLHPSGSTRMGLDAKNSVVNPSLRSHNVENLSVASGSVFPCAGSANPTLTIIQVALRAADAISARLGV